MKELHCRDIGFDCEGVIKGESEEEVMTQTADHAREVHGIEQLDSETTETIRSLIRAA